MLSNEKSHSAFLFCLSKLFFDACVYGNFLINMWIYRFFFTFIVAQIKAHWPIHWFSKLVVDPVCPSAQYKWLSSIQMWYQNEDTTYWFCALKTGKRSQSLINYLLNIWKVILYVDIRWLRFTWFRFPRSHKNFSSSSCKWGKNVSFQNMQCQKWK